jgi:amino acid adenylation domain-containing protein
MAKNSDKAYCCFSQNSEEMTLSGRDIGLGRIGSTVVDLLQSQAQKHRDKRLYTFLKDGEAVEDHLTFADLELRAKAIATVLQQRIRPGDRAVLLFPSGMEFVAAFYGCLMAGVIAVPTYPPTSPRTVPRLRAIVEDCRPAAVLTTSEARPRLQKLVAALPDMASVQWLSTDECGSQGVDGEWQPPGLTAESLAFLQYTSGSTATPKGVMVRHGNLLANQKSIQRAFRQSRESVVVGWLPLYHDMGLIGTVLQPLFVGGSCYLMSPMAFLQQPARWLQAISTYRATTSGGPNFAYELCADRISEEARGGLDLQSWEVAFNGAEPVRSHTLERFARVFAPCGFRPRAFLPCYGLAEATLFVAGGAGGDEGPRTILVETKELARDRIAEVAPADMEDGHRLVGCGPWAEALRIVDPHSGVPAPPDRVGEIWVAGASVTAGYWNRPEATEETFQGTLPDDSQRYLRTGDLGFVRQGELFITGRLKDLIILRGRNCYPHDIELTVEKSHSSLHPGGGAAFSVEVAGEERLVVVHEVRRRTAGVEVEVIADAARRAVAEEQEAHLHALVLIRTGTLPRTSSGKVQRRRCRELYRTGKLVEIGHSTLGTSRGELDPDPHSSAMPRGEARPLAEALRTQLAASLGVDPEMLTEDRPLTELGLDSLRAIELQQWLRESLQAEVSLAELLEGATLGAVVRRTREASEASEAPESALASLPSTPEPADGEAFPLAYGQRALYFLERLAGGSGVYNVVAAAQIGGVWRPEALRQAWSALVARHGALRTTFQETNEGVVQRRLSPGAIEIEEHILETSDPALLQLRLQHEGFRAFDLEHRPPWRLVLFHLPATSPVVLLSMHHIITDFASLRALLGELAEFYAAAVAERPLALKSSSYHYSDFVRWQEALLAGERGKALERYWRHHLAAAPMDLGLWTRGAVDGMVRHTAGCQRLRLPGELGGALEALAQECGATLFMVLLAAFQLLLGRYTRRDRVLVGSPFLGRPGRELAEVAGYFVNPLVLSGDRSHDPTFRGFVARVRRTTLAAFRHGDFPFPLLADRLQPERQAGSSPVFQAMFVFHASQRPEDRALAAFALGSGGQGAGEVSLGPLALRPVTLNPPVTQLPLTLTMGWVGKRLEARLDYSTELLDPATPTAMARHLRILLEGVTAQPGARCSRFPLLSPAEVHQLTVEANAVPAAPSRQHLAALFAAQAERTPDALAIIDGEGRSWSYRTLAGRARAVARRLMALGVGPGTLVGIALHRRLEMVQALLGVLQAGGAYVALDPAYPARRLERIATDARLELVLSESAVVTVAGLEGVRRLDLDDPTEFVDETDGIGVHPEADPEDPAYVLYTSGSTGVPKGVVICHRSAAALLAWAQRVFDSEELSVVLASTSIAFDLSVFEIFAPLSCGGRVVLAEDALALGRLSAEMGIRLVNTVPSAMAELVRRGQVPDSVRTVCLAGEPLSRRLARDLYAVPSVRAVYNLYGPSEDTTYSTWHRVAAARDTEPPIGRPVDGTQVYLLDPQQQLLPVGVAGELYLAGSGLARGYLGRPARTAGAFLPDPFAAEPGARMYRTGDLARYRPGDEPPGELEFLGRLDHQVKLRGFRIELGEIEAALLREPTIKDAVAVVRDDEAGQPRLVVYGVPAAPAAEPTLEDVRERLARRLPRYMLPEALVVLPELPRTPNGKIDRRALPAPRRVARGGTFRSPTEELLAGIWSRILGVQGVGPEDDFFALGGHSLLATQVLSRIRDVWSVELPVRALFEAPSVAQLAERIHAAQTDGTEGVALEGPRPRPRPDRLPLSFGQQRLWFLDQMEPGQAVYHIVAAIRLRGALRPRLLERSLAALVARHEALRTRLPEFEGQPCQVIEAPSALPLPVVNFSALIEANRWQATLGWARCFARRPFDLARGPLFRSALGRLDSADALLVINVHHAVADGWSLGVMIRELSALYSAAEACRSDPLPTPMLHYADFALWQRETQRGERLRLALDYWKGALEGHAAETDLPTDRPRSATSTYDGATGVFALPAPLVAELQRLALEQGATLYMVLLSSFQLLLARLGGSLRSVVGTPIANRQWRVLEDVVGFFANTLVMRGDLRDDPTFAVALARTRRFALGAYAHQDLPFEKLVEALSPRRDLARSPLFQCFFALQNAPLGRLRLGALSLQPEPLDTATAKFDLSLLLLEREDGGLEGTVEYRRDLFDHTTVERLSRRWTALLRQVGAVGGGEHRVWQVSLLEAAERHQLLVEWQGGAAAPPGTLHGRVEQWVQRTPQESAVVTSTGGLSYRELDRRAEALAWGLRRRGVRGGQTVGVAVGRSPEMVVAVLGILKAGASYLPLDPSYPPERRAFMLEDAGVPLVVGDRQGELPEGVSVLPVGDLTGDHLTPAAPLPEVPPTAPAYVLYTSGSTGRPKGVAMPHRALDNLMDWQIRRSGLPTPRTAQFTPLSFDVSCQEIFSTLGGGGTLVLVTEDERRDPGLLLELLHRQRVERLFLPFVALQQLAREALERDRIPVSLRQVITAGEQLRVDDRLTAFFEGLPEATLENQYGPTEAHVVSAHRLTANPSRWPALPPIGRAVQGVRLGVLEVVSGASGVPVPIGVVGELFLGGVALAQGYPGRPALTAERFLPDPHAGRLGARLYRTGDLARVLPDGDLEFLGRTDHQMKVRGFRIEPGEVEAALTAHPRVAQAAVTVWDGESGGRRLVAYVLVTAGETPPETAQLRATLIARLPTYMVPALFTFVEQLPLLPSGKVNRRALPAPQPVAMEGEHAPPNTPLEELLAGIWCQVLERETVGIHDDFFALGGHSLLATQVVSRIRGALNLELPVREIFEHPTLAGLAQRLQGMESPTTELAIVPVPRERSPLGPGQAAMPLSFAQQRLWFLDRLEPGSSAYNLGAAVRLEGPLWICALEASLAAIVRRHETLRTTFDDVEGKAVQMIDPRRQIPLPVVDLSALPDQEQEAMRTTLNRRRVGDPFDLHRGPLLRLGLWRRGPRNHTLVVTMHHIISDGWSLGVLVRELTALYRAAVAADGESAAPLPPLAVQYADFAHWQQRHFQGQRMAALMGYWRQRLEGFRPVRLPLDRPRDEDPGARLEDADRPRGARRPLRFSAALSDGLRGLARAQGVTLSTVLLAAFKVLLSQITGERDLTLGGEFANRTRLELEPLIGFFVNILLLRTDLRDEPSFAEILRRVHDTVLAADAHQDLPYDRLVQVLQGSRTAAGRGPAAVVFVLQNTPMPPFTLPGVEAGAPEPVIDVAKFDLVLSVADQGALLGGSFNYDPDLLEESTLERWATGLHALLEAVVEIPDLPWGAMVRTLDTAADRFQEDQKNQLKRAAVGRLRSLRRRSRGYGTELHIRSTDHEETGIEKGATPDG